MHWPECIHTYLQKKIEPVMKEFTGDIYQRPPQRTAVRRATRIRTVHSFDLLEQHERLILMRIVCQAGTYVRKIIYDLGEVLSLGATMIELRRTRVSCLSEKNESFVRLHHILDAFERYKESGDETKLRQLIKPIEYCLQGIACCRGKRYSCGCTMPWRSISNSWNYCYTP